MEGFAGEQEGGESAEDEFDIAANRAGTIIPTSAGVAGRLTEPSAETSLTGSTGSGACRVTQQLLRAIDAAEPQSGIISPQQE